MTIKHTAGPWRIVEVTYKYLPEGKKRQIDIRCAAVVMGAEGNETHRVADCRDEDRGEPEVDAANARLIAAALEADDA